MVVYLCVHVGGAAENITAARLCSSGMSGLSSRGKPPNLTPWQTKTIHRIKTRINVIDYVVGFYKSAKLDGDCTLHMKKQQILM